MAENITSASRPSTEQYRTWCLVIRLKCLIVAYLHLFAVIIDIIALVVVVGIVTDGFQCNVTERSLRNVDWYSLEPILLAVNIGTHGFYPIPLLIFGSRSLQSYTMDRDSQPICYPAMFHVHMSDVLNLMINIVWLYLVKKFVKAVREKDPETMIFFTGVGVFKLTIEVLIFRYLPEFRSIHNPDSIKFLKLLNIAISGLCLAIIYEYVKVIKAEKKRENETTVVEDDEPPSYSDCFVSSPPDSEDKTNTETVVDTQPEATSETRPTLDFKHIDGAEPPSYAELAVSFSPGIEDSLKRSEDNKDTETVVDIESDANSETLPIFTI